MSLAAAALAAAAHFEALTDAVKRYGSAARAARQSTMADQAEAEAIRRGQRPEQVEALRKALKL